MEYHQITINEYLELKQKIADKLNSMANDYITIGYYLKRIRDTEAYKQDGYTSLAEFAQKEYGFSEAATSRAIAVNTKFSVNGNTPLLLDNYKGFGSSKLSEMLTLSDEDIKLIKETTTVATIREIKRFNKESADDVKNDESQVNTQPEDDLNKVIIEFFRSEKELLDEVWQQSTEEDIAELINPTGSRTFKKGLYMLLFYEHKDGLALKKFGQAAAQTYSYYDFMSAMVDIFKNYYEDGKSVHEAFYGVTEKQVESTKNDTESVAKKTETVPEKEKTVSKENKTVSKENVSVEVVPGVSAEITDIEKASEAAVLEEKKAEILAINEIATSQVNTQLNDDYEEEKVIAEVVTEIKHIKIYKRNEKVEYKENEITVATGDCIDDIIWLIEKEISTEVASNDMVCEITFRKE